MDEASGRPEWAGVRTGMLSHRVTFVPLSEATAYGLRWAIVVGITLAVLSAIANFMFIPHYPFWALLVIALDVFVIWALAAHGRELRDASA